MALECVQVRRPEAAEGLDPGVQLLKRLRPEAIQPALRVHGRLHETGLSQHPQMLRDGRLRHAELALDLADRTMRREQEAQNGAAVWLGNDFKNRFHVFLYTSKGIFLSRYICLCAENFFHQPSRCAPLDLRRTADFRSPCGAVLCRSPEVSPKFGCPEKAPLAGFRAVSL